MKASFNNIGYPNGASVTPAVIVMVKAPRIGQVKTRLCPSLSPEDAAALAACFARDVAAKALSVGCAVLMAFTPDDGRAILEPLLPPGLQWTTQVGTSLGERMQNAVEDASARGYGPLGMIGTDSPTLPSSLIRNAIDTLSTGEADAVFGPADDGGYYLVGVRRPHAGLFDDIAWSTSRALADTLRNAAARQLRVSLLPPWYDVDTPEDLRRLRTELLENATARECAPHTHQWLTLHEDFDNRPYA